ncbi:YndM family protein [Oceanobacillus senegalensis]|uniref:YndM family protein n=1 Tax=Oceanobacillus senegalensis TaxID=1936063 RepID=UPI000A30EC16|nr:YndM family protein [Oceanobacillus senegalensis]
MKHLKALVIKFLITSVVLYSFLTIFNTATLSEIFLISLLVTGLAYVIGDLLILPRFGNFVAALADFGLAFASIWALSAFFIDTASPLIIISATSAFFLAICEALFHAYMQNKILENDHERKDNTYVNTRLQAEFSEEENVDYIKKKNKHKD